MADRKELDMDNLDEVAGGVKKSVKVDQKQSKTKSKRTKSSGLSGQNDNSGVIINQTGENNKAVGVNSIGGDGNINI